MVLKLCCPTSASIMAAPTKETKRKEMGKNTSLKTAAEAGKKKTSHSSFFLTSVTGVIIAIAAALWTRVGGGKDAIKNANQSNASPTQIPSRQLLNPSPGSWTDGYYTTETVPGQPNPSTHAILYPNGGGGEPEFVSFSNDEKFLAMGRLYNDLGQIVQSPTQFPNGTALYRGPDKLGTHYQWPAGESMLP
jgi:hypothetical protein